MKVKDVFAGAAGVVGKVAGIQRPTLHINDLVGMDGVSRDRVRAGGGGTAVWRVYGKDSADSVAMNGWGRFLLALDFPVSFLIRQHPPGLSQIMSELRESRPVDFNEGPGAEVSDSLLDYFGGMERSGSVVDREIYLLASERNAAEVPSLLDGGGMNSMAVEDESLRRLCYGAVTGRSVSSLLTVDMAGEEGFGAACRWASACAWATGGPAVSRLRDGRGASRCCFWNGCWGWASRWTCRTTSSRSSTGRRSAS